MIDAKVLEGVKVLIATYGRLTCGVLADKMRMPPSSMVYFLRDAVGAGVLTECNGFYDVPRPRPQPTGKTSSAVGEAPIRWCEYRKVLPWIKGYTVPSLVKEFAMGVLTCESVYVVMEIDKDMQSKGVPLFTLGYIDVRLGKFIDGNTGWNVTRHVVRYLVVDRTPVPSGNVKSGEVA
ncbi:hypothetical protein PSQ70_002779 [Salmonella enterica]|nr:hypothetical protein [Salmonella enterica subsp. enterica serovar Mbandaka]EEI9389808.1 hypothetical protein [Salmonella enterica subsp. enterica serovar Mbandaka]EKE0950795.1 hypothetical protein [Salmonella enterica]EKL8763703.1 hypothetical protein [Salmonella enterica]ELJ9127830.1 hypothetical protein [Salmonella enterica]